MKVPSVENIDQLVDLIVAEKKRPRSQHFVSRRLDTHDRQITTQGGPKVKKRSSKKPKQGYFFKVEESSTRLGSRFDLSFVLCRTLQFSIGLLSSRAGLGTIQSNTSRSLPIFWGWTAHPDSCQRASHANQENKTSRLGTQASAR